MENKNEMFCYQCQETMAGSGCSRVGMCGKKPDVAAMQDLLIWVTKGLSAVATQLRREKKDIPVAINHLVTANLYATVTNANFDKEVLVKRITETVQEKERLLAMTEKKQDLPEAAFWTGTESDYEKKAASVGVLATKDEDIRSFRELIIYGIKGLSGYLFHANALGSEDQDIDMFIQRALGQMLDDSLTGGNLLALVMETGRYGVRVMDLLDRANTGTYGNPEITSVKTGVGTNPAILVFGQDLKDLEMLLEQTQGTGVDVYTHGEMLPAQYYPKFRKYDNLIGNYGNAWWKQKEEFESFNGPVLVTSEEIIPPKDSYKERLFTTGCAAYPGCAHIEADENGQKDFSALIELAKKCEAPKEIESGEIVGGYAREQVFSMTDKIVEAVKSGEISRFIVMAGSDGRAKTRSYYTDFAKALPKDTVILTAGSAKYRYNKLDLGEAGGLPRVLDAGQCSDVYSIVQIALKLKEAFGYENINQLPIVYNLAWHDQKSIIVLLSLLYLDVKHIHLGPTMPAFFSANVANVLIKYFGIAQIKTVQEDIDAMLGGSDQLIRPDMIVGDIVQQYPQLVDVMMSCGLHCIGCGVSQVETLEEACMTHGLDVYDMLDVLNDELNNGNN
uniref:hydroxylamine reductase n=1 Tax=Eubacterium cellulosolvens TaxID=29322 RepID=UPI0004882C14|nr:hydroxylamine reductase [[Eubacterium] cellulosolvens]